MFPIKEEEKDFVIFPPIGKFDDMCEKLSPTNKFKLFQYHLEILNNYIKTGKIPEVVKGQKVTIPIAYIYSRLAACYYFGWGTSKDIKKAFEMYQFTYDTFGQSHAACWLGCIYETGENDVVSINKKKAFEFHSFAYNKKEDMPYKDPYYTVNLANCYLNGIGTTINIERAFQLYREFYAITGDINCMIDCNYETGIEQAKLKMIRGDYTKHDPVYMLIKQDINNRRLYTKEILNQIPKELNNIISEYID